MHCIHLKYKNYWFEVDIPDEYWKCVIFWKKLPQCYTYLMSVYLEQCFFHENNFKKYNLSNNSNNGGVLTSWDITLKPNVPLIFFNNSISSSHHQIPFASQFLKHSWSQGDKDNKKDNFFRSGNEKVMTDLHFMLQT